MKSFVIVWLATIVVASTIAHAEAKGSSSRSSSSSSRSSYSSSRSSSSSFSSSPTSSSYSSARSSRYSSPRVTTPTPTQVKPTPTPVTPTKPIQPTYTKTIPSTVRSNTVIVSQNRYVNNQPSMGSQIVSSMVWTAGGVVVGSMINNALSSNQPQPQSIAQTTQPIQPTPESGSGLTEEAIPQPVPEQKESNSIMEWVLYPLGGILGFFGLSKFIN